jgi:hypothetical protein
MLDDVRLDRKIRWAANLFIWSAVVVLVVSGFTFFNDWHPSYSSSIEAVGSLFSFLAVRLLYNDWFYILVLVNALVLRRYKSRIAAALLIVVSLYGLGLAVYMLWLVGATPIVVVTALIYGFYLAIAAWTFVALMRQGYA